MTERSQSKNFTARFDAASARLPIAGKRVYVALSGGLDSTLLLDALASARVAEELRAIHIDHGLHHDSAAWSRRCGAFAESLGVELVTRKLALEPAAGQSIEAAAREARYAAFADVIEAGDVVVTAHHADDQLETVLLRLLRGAGVRGLTGIHALRPLGDGWLARPLLEFTRAELEAEALSRKLEWLEDPSNIDTRFDRNFLRHRILPALYERWPEAGPAAVRLAAQMSEAEQVLSDMAAADLAPAEDAACIPTAVLTALSEPRLNNALRHAIRRADLPIPTAAQLAELRRALQAREDAEVMVCWPGAEARVYRRQLYLMRPLPAGAPAEGRITARSAFDFGAGTLKLVATEDYGIPDRWANEGLDVAFRRGGERFKPHGSAHSKSLKQWFQEAGIVPWMRSAVPLIYHAGELVAVADMSLAANMPRSDADAPFWRPVWTGHDRLR